MCPLDPFGPWIHLHPNSTLPQEAKNRCETLRIAEEEKKEEIANANAHASSRGIKQQLKSNEKSYDAEDINMETLEETIKERCANNKETMIKDPWEEEEAEDDSSSQSADRMGLTREERKAYERLRKELNEDESSEDSCDDTPVVPLELLDEVEEKLMKSAQNKENLQKEKSALLQELETKDLQHQQKITFLEEKIEKLDAALRSKSRQLANNLKRMKFA